MHAQRNNRKQQVFSGPVPRWGYNILGNCRRSRQLEKSCSAPAHPRARTLARQTARNGCLYTPALTAATHIVVPAAANLESGPW